MSKPKSFFELLFGSKARTKILKFLFRNPGMAFSINELAERVQEPRAMVGREVNNFLEVGLIKIKR